jgi:hypothetical protein
MSGRYVDIRQWVLYRERRLLHKRILYDERNTHVPGYIYINIHGFVLWLHMLEIDNGYTIQLVPRGRNT